MYVKTRFGNIPVEDIPVVQEEDLTSKLFKSAIFFAIIVVILCTFIYLFYSSNYDKNKPKTQVTIDKSEKIYKAVKADAIKIYNYNEDISLDNFSIITTEGNIFNINKSNKNLKIYTKYSGIMYSMDLGSEMEIKQVVISSGDVRPNKYYNIELLNNDKKVWEYSGKLEIKPYTTIETYIESDSPVSITDIKNQRLENLKKLYAHSLNSTTRIITNESELQLLLTQDDEQYFCT
jgi:hypothetical protein